MQGLGSTVPQAGRPEAASHVRMCGAHTLSIYRQAQAGSPHRHRVQLSSWSQRMTSTAALRNPHLQTQPVAMQRSHNTACRPTCPGLGPPAKAAAFPDARQAAANPSHGHISLQTSVRSESRAGVYRAVAVPARAGAGAVVQCLSSHQDGGWHDGHPQRQA